jgi:hypothetical protein
VAMGAGPKPAPRQPEDVYRQRIAHFRRALLRVVAPRAPLGAVSPTEA